MKHFDVLKFLHVHKIPYITKGVNVKRNEININCPFCAKTRNPDPSYHLGIDLDRLQFSCWRNRRQHRGRTLHKLIMLLLKCSYPEACKLLGQELIWLEDGVFESLDFTYTTVQATASTLEFTPEIIPLDFSEYKANRFGDYLVSHRGFDSSNLSRLSKKYRLHYALSGRFKDRIVVPNYAQNRLINWTGRSIYPTASLRYLTLDATLGALVSIKNCLFNESSLFRQGGRILLIHEGPFDAVKTDFYGAAYGVRATCLFNQTATVEQLGGLGQLGNMFDKLVVMLDRGEDLAQAHLLSQLSWLPSDWIMEYPCPCKDPGELTSAQVTALCNHLLDLIN